jgi:hypothetical protein
LKSTCKNEEALGQCGQGYSCFCFVSVFQGTDEKTLIESVFYFSFCCIVYEEQFVSLAGPESLSLFPARRLGKLEISWTDKHRLP